MTVTALADTSLPVGSTRRTTIAWWGVMTLIATEGALFAYLLFSYYYCKVQLGRDFGEPLHPQLRLSLPNTIVLLASSVAVWWGDRGIKNAAPWKFFLGFGVGTLLGVLFLMIQSFEWQSQGFTLTSSLYSSLFFTVTGFHMAHVVVGVLGLAAILIWGALGYFDDRRCVPVLISAAYWHFVDVVWLFVFFSFYITPYLE